MTDTKKLLNSPNNMGFEDKITAAVAGRFLSQEKGEVDMFDDKTIDDKITTGEGLLRIACIFFCVFFIVRQLSTLKVLFLWIRF